MGVEGGFAEECGGGEDWGGGRGMKVRARRLVYASGAPRGVAAGESRAA